LERIISSFILLLGNITRRLFIGIDSSGFKLSNASQYYAHKVNLKKKKKKKKKKYLKLSIGGEVLYQIICALKIRRAPTRHDTVVDFLPIVEGSSEILPLSIVVANKGYDSEGNHTFVREKLFMHSL
jgi:hypothetical protein